MIREEERNERVSKMEEEIEYRNNCTAELRSAKNKLTKETVFEETLLGAIEAEETAAFDKMWSILNALEDATGKTYHCEIKPSIENVEIEEFEDAESIEECSRQKPRMSADHMEDSVHNLVRRIYKAGGWNSMKLPELKNWVIRQVLNTNV